MNEKLSTASTNKTADYVGGLEMKRQRGFSLIELLVVITIILIIAAIAVPSYLKAKASASETSTIGTLKALATAEGIYSNQFQMFAGTLGNLGGTPGATSTCAAFQSLDNNLVTALAAGTFKGYSYTYTVTGTAIAPTVGPCAGVSGNPGFVLSAVPLNSSNGGRSFCTDESNSVHYDIALSVPVTENACEVLPTL